MNNSDQPLSQAEERLAAYLDGRLSRDEAAAFEREHPEAASERRAIEQLGTLLRRNSTPPALRNPEFFNRQIRREIESSEPRSAAPQKQAHPFFSLWRLALAGAFCVLICLGVYHAYVRPSSTTAPRPYLAQVLSVKTGDDSLKTRLISEEGLTLVMIDGLEPMSEEFILN